MMNNTMIQAYKKISIIFLYISVIFVPFATNLPNFMKGEKFFLFFATLFCGTYAFTLILSRQLWRQIYQQRFLFQYAFIITFLATLRYVIALLAGDNIGFFGTYTIPVLLTYSFFVSTFCANQKQYIYKLSMLFCTECSILLILYQNRFMLDMDVYRFIGIYANPNVCGMFCVCSCMLSICLLSCRFGYKILNIVNFAIAAGALILTYSRACLLALICGLLFYTLVSVFNLKRKLTRQKILTIIFIVTILALLNAIVYIVLSPDKKDSKNVMDVGTSSNISNISDIMNENDNTKVDNSAALNRFSLGSEISGSILHNMRLEIWYTYTKNICHYFWIGAKNLDTERPVVCGAVRDTHNTFLYTFFHYGIFGLLSFIFLVINLMFKFIHVGRKKYLYSGFCGVFVALMIICLFGDWLKAAIFAFIIAIMYASLYDAENNMVKNE